MAKNLNKLSAFTLLMVCLSALTVYADNNYFVSTRGEGIGFAFSTLADEPFGALYNPSAPAFARGFQFQAGFQRPAAYGLSALDESPYGGIAGVNYYAEKLGSFALNTHQFGSFSDPTDLTSLTSFNLSYARLLDEKWAVGAGVKYMFESNFDERSVFDLDLGVTWRPIVNVSLAAVGRNLLKAELTPETAGFPEHLTRKISLAGAYNIGVIGYSGSFLAGWQLSQAGELETKNSSLFNLGTEWWLGTAGSISLGLRGGYTFGKATVAESNLDYNRWSAGLSLNFDMNGRDLRIDYGIRSYPFESDETLTADNFISVSYGWGGVPNYYTEKSDTKYDLSKYQNAQTRQEPAMTMTPPESQRAAIETPAEELQLPATTAVPTESQPTAIDTPIEEPELPAMATIPSESQPAANEVPIEQPQLPATATIPPESQPAASDTPIEQPQLPVMAIAPTESQSQPIEMAMEEPQSVVENESEPELSIAQLTTIEPPSPAQPIAPSPVQAPAAPKFEKLALHLEMTQLSTGISNRIIFNLTPDGLINISSWKLYVFVDKLKKWDDDAANSHALAIIDGKGVTPLNVVWDGELLQGDFIQRGKYCFVVVAQDNHGGRYMSDWQKFSIK